MAFFFYIKGFLFLFCQIIELMGPILVRIINKNFFKAIVFELPSSSGQFICTLYTY